jgi:isocitrate dehydrogenase
MSGEKVTVQKGKIIVPDFPVIPYIEGDGIGRDIWQGSKFVIDSAVQKAYGDSKQIQWLEVFAGEKSFNKSGTYLPDETLSAFTEYLIGIKGPLTTPVGGGIRSLNVALRQNLDLYVCLRPVKYYGGIDTPMRRPDKVDMIVFRENTEDIYTGVEFKAGTDANKKILGFIQKEFPAEFNKIRFGTTEKANSFLKLANLPLETETSVGVGIKVISKTGTERLMTAAINYALENKRQSVTIVHKGNIMKFTSGAFAEWCYDTAETIFNDKVFTMRQWKKIKDEYGKKKADDEFEIAYYERKIIIKDAIADNALQLVLLKPQDFDIIATENLNGDYLSDAIAAQVGGIGIAPGANINYITGHAIFEATHGTAPDIAGLDTANPSSLILSAKMMLEYMNWTDAAKLIEKGIRKSIKSKYVTKDFARQIHGAMEVKCSDFCKEIVKNFTYNG